MKTLSLLSVFAFDNTLTGLIPDLYAAMDVVSREKIGFIPSVTRNASAERAAVGQSVTYPISGEANVSDIVPAMTTPEPTDQTVENDAIQITKARAAEFGFVGEEQLGLNNGAGFLTVQGDMIAQALRKLTNEVEDDLAAEAGANASRFIGTAGTTPFATTHADTAQLKKVLDDNGADGDRSLVMNTTAGANIRSLNNLTRVNEAGTAMTLRDGQLLDLNGLSLKESNGIIRPVVGTASSATTDNAGYAVGAKTITLASAGTGTILAGDVISFAGDAHAYCVETGNADVSSGGTIVLHGPGLRQAIAASAVAITVKAQGMRNIAFSRTALHLVTRMPALPDGEDAAVASMEIVDQRSGMTFEVRKYLGYRKARYDIGLAWGVKAAKPAHIAGLFGE